MKEKNPQLFGNALLFLTSLLWGSGFIAQKAAAAYITPLHFNGLRYLIAFCLILIFAKGKLPFRDENGKTAVLAGCILSCAAAFQQMGLMTASVTNTSFITAAYIVMVPFFSAFFFKRRVPKSCFPAALIALIGIWLLSTNGKGFDSISSGDIIVFIGSIFWALHIITVEKGASQAGDPISFSAGQFLVAGLLQLIIGLFAEGFSFAGTEKAVFPTLYSGIFVIGIAFTLQVIGQQYTGGAVASIIMGLESVFGTLFSVLIFHEELFPLQILGAVLIFAAVIIVVLKD